MAGLAAQQVREPAATRARYILLHEVTLFPCTAAAWHFGYAQRGRSARTHLLAVHLVNSLPVAHRGPFWRAAVSRFQHLSSGIPAASRPCGCCTQRMRCWRGQEREFARPNGHARPRHARPILPSSICCSHEFRSPPTGGQEIENVAILDAEVRDDTCTDHAQQRTGHAQHMRALTTA